jgi:hypothetical protein
MEDVDLAPTPQAAAAVAEVLNDSRALQESWQAIKAKELPALNQGLRTSGLPVIGIVN